jgi:diphosphomevalonate decarboxylase
VVTVYFGEGSKEISSLEGHRAALSSPYYVTRLASIPATLEQVRRALAKRDFDALGNTIEREAVAFHAIAMTSSVTDRPWLSGIYYWKPETLALIQTIQSWRAGGLPAYFTLDAGPSVHLLCEAQRLEAVLQQAAPIVSAIGAETIISEPGRGAWVVDADPASDPTCRA